MRLFAFLLFTFALVSRAWAVPLFDAITSNFVSGSGATITISHTTGGTDRLIMACIQMTGAGTSG